MFICQRTYFFPGITVLASMRAAGTANLKKMMSAMWLPVQQLWQPSLFIHCQFLFLSNKNNIRKVES